MTKLFIALSALALLLISQSAVSNDLRVVSLTPAISETLIALGLEANLVGRDQASDLASIEQLPVVANYQQVFFEGLLRTRPTHVVAWRDSLPDYLPERLKQFDIQLLISDTSTLDTWQQSNRQIAQSLGADPSSIDRWNAKLDDLSRRYREAAKVSMAWLLWDRPLMVVGNRGYLNDIIQLCGGRNLFDQVDATNPTIDPERMIRAAPELLVGKREWTDKFGAWQQIPAIRDQAVWTPPNDLLSRPGPKLVQGIQATCQAIDLRRNSLGR